MVGSCATVLGHWTRVVKALLVQSFFKRTSGQTLTQDQMEQSFGSLPVRLKAYEMDHGAVYEDCVLRNSRLRKLAVQCTRQNAKQTFCSRSELSIIQTHMSKLASLRLGVWRHPAHMHMLRDVARFHAFPWSL